MATTYISNADAETLTGYELTDLEINAAEADLDDIALGAHTRSTTAPFRKLTPSTLTDAQEDGLKRATAEQIKYRKMMGEEFFVKSQRASGSADGISYSGKLPHIGPKVLAILADVGLVNRLGTITGSRNYDLEDIGYSPY